MLLKLKIQEKLLFSHKFLWTYIITYDPNKINFIPVDKPSQKTEYKKQLRVKGKSKQSPDCFFNLLD